MYLTHFHQCSVNIILMWQGQKIMIFFISILHFYCHGKFDKCQEDDHQQLKPNLLQPSSIQQVRVVFLIWYNLIFRWSLNKTRSTGTTANFQVIEGSLYRAHDWTTSLDCDFLISIELGEWPETAKGWISQPRQWPTPEVQLTIDPPLVWDWWWNLPD